MTIFTLLIIHLYVQVDLTVEATFLFLQGPAALEGPGVASGIATLDGPGVASLLATAVEGLGVATLINAAAAASFCCSNTT